MPSRSRYPRMARDSGMSVFHFARIFGELEGRPPHRFLTDVRLAHADRAPSRRGRRHRHLLRRGLRFAQPLRHDVSPALRRPAVGGPPKGKRSGGGSVRVETGHGQHGEHGTNPCAVPLTRGPATRRRAEPTRTSPDTSAPGTRSGGLDSTTIRASRGGQWDGPCHPWQTDPRPAVGLICPDSSFE